MNIFLSVESGVIPQEDTLATKIGENGITKHLPYSLRRIQYSDEESHYYEADKILRMYTSRTYIL